MKERRQVAERRRAFTVVSRMFCLKEREIRTPRRRWIGRRGQGVGFERVGGVGGCVNFSSLFLKASVKSSILRRASERSELR